MFRSLARAARTTLAMPLLALPAALTAQPITYTFNGTGSGTYGSTSFIDAPFTISILGDVSTPYTGSTSTVVSFDGLKPNVSIGGVLTNAPFGGVVYLYRNQTFGSQSIGFGGGGTDYFDIFAAGPTDFTGYDLRSSFGPVTGSIDVRGFIDVTVDGQYLSFSSVEHPTFEAVAAVTATPEPATLVLVGTGAFGLGLVARRHTRNR